MVKSDAAAVSNLMQFCKDLTADFRTKFYEHHPWIDTEAEKSGMRDLIASGKMKMAIERLVARYPILGGIAAQWTHIEDRSIGKMGIGMRGFAFALRSLFTVCRRSSLLPCYTTR